jgi:outer membrane cobalamin receptor
MNKKLFLSVLLIISTFTLGNAQEKTLTGFIMDGETRKPLVSANVYFKNAGIGTLTDDNGYFRLYYRPSDKTDTLVISYIGYKEMYVDVKKYSNNTKIYLKSESLNLPEIIVSADRIDILKQEIPQTKRTIQLEEIKRYGSNEFSDILKPLPSVRIEGNDLDGRKIQIRGSDPDEVNVYLDGVLLNNVRFDNAADLSVIPVEAVERIEILNGGNSAFLGNGAFGGVVNITTRRSTKRSLAFKGKMGSSESRYFIGDMTIPMSKRFSIGYFGQLYSMKPEIEYFQDELYAEKSLNNTITTQKQNHIVSLNYFIPSGYLNTQFIGYKFDYTKDFWKSNYSTYSVSASYKGDIFKLKEWDILINSMLTEDRIQREPAGSTSYISDFKSNLFNFRLAKKFSYSAGESQILVEYFHDGLITSSKVSDVNWTNTLYHGNLYDNRVGFAWVSSFNDELKNIPTLSWKTYLGLRGDMLASGNQDLYPMIGAQIDYKLAQWNLTVYTNYGKNVKYPSLQKNAYIRDVINVSGTDTAYQRLKPEYSNSTEIGVNLQYFPKSKYYRQFDFSVSAFTRSIYNKILTRPFDDIIATVQTGRNLTRGVETSFQFYDIFNRFSLSGAYVYLDISNPLAYAYKPDQNLSATLSYVSPLGIYLVSTYFYEGKSIAWYYNAANEFQTQEITPFHDMDVSVGMKIPFHSVQIDIQFAGYNIFDNAGFKYYYLRKRFLQASMGIRY